MWPVTNGVSVLLSARDGMQRKKHSGSTVWRKISGAAVYPDDVVDKVV